MKHFKSLIIILAIISVALVNCKKEEVEPFKGVQGTTVYTLKTLSGVVVDETNTPLQGVTVTAHGKSYTTKKDGFFVFEDLSVSGERYIVNFAMQGYFDISRSEALTEEKPAQLRVGMISHTGPNTATTTFLAQDGGAITDAGGKLNITFPANNFITASGVTYTGNVNVFAVYLDPSDNNFTLFSPGGDQSGVNHTGADVKLRAFAGMIVELRDDAGSKLNLNPNVDEDATYDLDIPGAIEASAPSNIEVWSYDDEGGTKTLSAATPTGTNSTASQTGGRYRGALGHFSYVGCELAYISTTKVKGHVTDDSGNGVPGVIVSVGQIHVITNETGYYERIVPSGVAINVGIFPDYFGTIIPPQNVTPSGNTTVNLSVPDLVAVTGRFVDCDGNPVPGHVVAWDMNNLIEVFTTSNTFLIYVPIRPPTSSYLVTVISPVSIVPSHPVASSIKYPLTIAKVPVEFP